jgi:hypothetical protein
MLLNNIKRSINILGVPDLIAKIKSWNAKYPTKVFVAIKMMYLKLKLHFVCYQLNLLPKKQLALYGLYCSLKLVFLS